MRLFPFLSTSLWLRLKRLLFLTIRHLPRENIARRIIIGKCKRWDRTGDSLAGLTLIPFARNTKCIDDICALLCTTTTRLAVAATVSATGTPRLSGTSNVNHFLLTWFYPTIIMESRWLVGTLRAAKGSRFRDCLLSRLWIGSLAFAISFAWTVFVHSRTKKLDRQLRAKSAKIRPMKTKKKREKEKEEEDDEEMKWNRRKMDFDGSSGELR